MALLRWCRVNWDRAAGIGLSALGVLALLVGWARFGDVHLLEQQLPYVISGGLGALVLIGIGGALWISADLRDEWRVLDRVEDRLADRAARTTRRDPGPAR